MQFGFFSSPQQVFFNPAVQLSAISPFAGLAALSPTAALAAVSPALNIFNPAVNPRAAFLAFNPGAAPALALTGGFSKPYWKGEPYWKGKPYAKGNPYAKGKPFVKGEKVY